MRINTNVSALNAWRNMTGTDNAMGKSLERLSSGFRINRAADDAAGLAISEKMRGQIKGLNMAVKNAQDGISVIQTAEGALNETHAILQRMRELATQASNDTNTASDRFEIQKEVNQLTEELTRIGQTTEFNTKALLDGSFKDVKFHIGANEGQNISVSIANMQADALKVTADKATWNGDKGNTKWDVAATANDGIDNLKAGTYKVVVKDDLTVSLQTQAGVEIGTSSAIGAGDTTVDITVSGTSHLVDATATTITLAIGDEGDGTTAAATAGTATINVLEKDQGISVMNQTDASSAITKIQSALDSVSAQRSNLGAVQNRLEHTIANLSVASENLSAAESRIRDVDMAAEMATLTKHQILMQAGTAMLAQANQKPQSVLNLLR